MCQNFYTYAHQNADRSLGATIYPEISRVPYHDRGAKAAARKSSMGTTSATSAESPCQNCYMVADPQSCNDAGCRVWQRWFLSQWNATRKSVSQHYQQIPLQEVGVMIGGIRYAPPHRRREFLLENPCDRCRCPWELCQGDCTLRQYWIAGVQEVLQ